MSGVERECGGGQRRGGGCCDAEEEALASEAVAERAGERRRECGREHPREPGDADGLGPADLVGEDAERHEVRPLGADRGSPGKLDSAQAWVPHRGPQCCRRLCWTAHTLRFLAAPGAEVKATIRPPMWRCG